MPDDLASGLLAAIEQREQAAKAVEPLGHNFDMGGNRQDEKFTHARVRYASEDGMPRTVEGNEQQHFSNWDPESVLRLCRAHRNIIDMYQQAKARPVCREGREARLRGLDHASAMGRLTTLGLVIEALAEGYDLKGTP